MDDDDQLEYSPEFAAMFLALIDTPLIEVDADAFIADIELRIRKLKAEQAARTPPAEPD